MENEFGRSVSRKLQVVIRARTALVGRRVARERGGAGYLPARFCLHRMRGKGAGLCIAHMQSKSGNLCWKKGRNFREVKAELAEGRLLLKSCDPMLQHIISKHVCTYVCM